jgi:hypothetical protein
LVVGDELDLPGGILGEGITPNLTPVLETEHGGAFDPARYNGPNEAAARPDAARRAGTVTVTAPAAFGVRSFAPIRRLADGGRGPDGQTGRFGNRGLGYPTSPAGHSRTAR